MANILTFEKDGKSYKIDIYEGYANWYAMLVTDEDYPLFEYNEENCIAEGNSSRQVWQKLAKLGYTWKS